VSIELVHYVRTKVATVLDGLASATPGIVDMLASRTWLGAATDTVLKLTTGKSLGEWSGIGLHKLSDELKSGEMLSGGGFWAMTGVLATGMAATTIKAWEDIIQQEMQEADPYAVLRARGPEDSEEYAAWAVRQAKHLGMSLGQFLIARKQAGAL